MNQTVTPFRLRNGLMAIGLLLFGWTLVLRANTADEIFTFTPGIRTSSQFPLTDWQRQSLLDGLRFSTGFSEIKFDETSRLTLGNRALVSGGSATVRRLIIAAVDSADSFTLESRYHSSSVAFAEIEDTADYRDANGKHVLWQVRLDFFDFTTLRGGRPILAAFDPAFNLFHELAHGVLKLKDPLDGSDLLGDCERYLNLIRAELGLPEREAYLPRQRLASLLESQPQVMMAEFRFAQRHTRTGKTQHLYLTFDLGRVCNLGGAPALSSYIR
jgi:hypothetical protein